MWMMTKWRVLLGFSAWLIVQVRCEQTCKRYSKDVECPELTLKYGTVCYEWSLSRILGRWRSSSATVTCDSLLHLSREHTRLNCKKRCTFIHCTFSWDNLTPTCDQLGSSDESLTSGSITETSADAKSTTTALKTENKTMYTSSTHEYNYTDMKRTASDQPDPMYMKTVYLTVPLGLCAATVLVLAVYLKYRRKQAKRDVTNCGNDYAAEVLVQRAAVNITYDETNVISNLVTNATSALNEITYYNANFDQMDEQDNLGNDEYDQIGVSSHVSLDPMNAKTSENTRLQMCCRTNITHEQYDREKFDTIYDESEPISSQKQEILNSEISNLLIASASGSSDYLHVINDTNTSKQSSEEDWPYYSNAEIDNKK